MSCTSVIDSNTISKKCGEIIITMKKNTKNIYSFSCWYCDTICLQMKKFTLHLEREHITQLEASFTSSENNKQEFDDKVDVQKPAIVGDISVGEIKIEDGVHYDIKSESGEEHFKIATIPTEKDELSSGFHDPLDTFEESIDEKQTIHFDNYKEDVEMHNLSDEDYKDHADLSGDEFSSDCDWKNDDSADEAYAESVKGNTKAKEKKIILALIEEFHKRPQLWNTMLSAKCNLKQKEDLLQSITDVLNAKLKIKLKLYMVKKKLNFICKQYEKEIERQLYETTDHTKDADNSQLWFFQNMSFLKTTIENKLKLKKKKPNHKVDLSGNAQPSTSELRDASHIRSKIISGECKIVTKIGKSKVWEIFGEVEMNGSINQKIVACRICNAVYRFNGTSILVKHKCYKESIMVNNHMVDVDQLTKVQVAKAITHWTISNCRPLKMVEDDGLLKYTELVLSIGAKYGREVDVGKMIPHPTTLSRNIDKLYGETYNLLQSEINDISEIGFAITTDLWTDNYAKTSYLALTIHFAKNASLNTRLLGFESMSFESCTKDKILKKVTKTLQKFQCSLDKGIIVTDMKDAFSGYKHIFCFDHLMHNILEKAIKETVDIEYLCTKCTKLLKYFKKSGCNAEFTMTLKNFTPTRWNTIYFLLKSVHQNWTQIGKILQEKNQLHRISGINVNVMRQVMDVLRGFAETSKKLEGDSYPTLHLALIHVNFLQRLCAAENSNDQDCVKDFKSKLNVLLGEVVTKNLTIHHKIAVFLFPPTNKMLQFSSDEKQLIRQHCKDMMEIFANDDSTPIQNTTVANLSIENENIFTGFLQTSLQANVCDKIQYELSAYENVYEVLHDDFDVMLWWELNKPKFPLLYQVSSWILATPASSAPSERVLSAARNLLSEERCVIGWNPASVEKIMFLHHNMKI